MCRICEIDEELNLLHTELLFRIDHYQKELAFGRVREAREAMIRGKRCYEMIFPLLDERVKLVAEEDRDEPKKVATLTGEEFAEMFLSRFTPKKDKLN